MAESHLRVCPDIGLVVEDNGRAVQPLCRRLVLDQRGGQETPPCRVKRLRRAQCAAALGVHVGQIQLAVEKHGVVDFHGGEWVLAAQVLPATYPHLACVWRRRSTTFAADWAGRGGRRVDGRRHPARRP